MQNTSTNVSNTTAKTINTMPERLMKEYRGISPPKGTVSAKHIPAIRCAVHESLKNSGSQQNMLPVISQSRLSDMVLKHQIKPHIMEVVQRTWDIGSW